MKAKCPVCSKEATKSFQKETATYYRCGDCETVFQFPMPSPKEMQDFANSLYKDGAYADYVKAKPMKVHTFRQRLESVKPHLAGRGRIRHLDVGCSAGFMIEVGLEAGFDSFGVEFSSQAVSYALPEVQKRITLADVNQLEAGEGYDLITCFDIIEHLRVPADFLKTLKRLLKPGGLLVLTTPDVSHPLAKVMGSRWPMLQPFQHTILFSKSSLNRVLSQVGLQTVSEGPAFKVLSFHYLAGQLQDLNPVISKVMKATESLIPGKLAKEPIRLNISEFMTIAENRAQ